MSPEQAAFKGTDLDYINDQISDMQAQFFRINELDGHGRFYNHITAECVLSHELKYLTLMGSKSNETPFLDNAFEKLCQQVRVYNEDIYQIEGV